ncbi:hypothetical protein ACWDPI_17515, partial [Streptomyces zhihengii]
MTVPALLPGLGSPVGTAYARLAEVFAGLSVTELGAGDPAPSGDGWVLAGDLAAGGPALDAFLAWDDAQVRRDYGRPGRPDVIASFGLHRYAWSACLLVNGTLFQGVVEAWQDDDAVYVDLALPDD